MQAELERIRNDISNGALGKRSTLRLLDTLIEMAQRIENLENVAERTVGVKPTVDAIK